MEKDKRKYASKDKRQCHNSKFYKRYARQIIKLNQVLSFPYVLTFKIVSSRSVGMIGSFVPLPAYEEKFFTRDRLVTLLNDRGFSF